ncbi:hypothetical protein PENTCL1PPCAC_22666, partial [Pristionchus entomophagus]
ERLLSAIDTSSHTVSIEMLGARRAMYQICRWTSLGPPPPVPSSPGSISHKYNTFISKSKFLHALHNRVVNGSRWCMMDVKEVWELRSIDMKKESELNKLTIPQLETLVQSPREVKKTILLILTLNIPGPGDILILLLIFFPRLILTRHFWTREQREEFWLADIKKGVEAAKTLTQSSLPSKIEELTQVQKGLLSRLYGGIFPWSSSKLNQRYFLTHNIDSRLDVSSLTRDQLLFHLYIRRVPYVINESEDSLRKRLTNVIEIGGSASSPVEYLTSSLRSL